MKQTLSHDLDASAIDSTLADGTFCRTISTREVMRLADEANITGREIEIGALKQDIYPDRYIRNMNSLVPSDQIKLLESTIGIIGLGGLGGLVTETLARMGVGRLHLIDGDVFEAHNLNRQLLSSTDNLGQSKAEVAGIRVNTINPGIVVVISSAYIALDNADKLIESCDIVVDCMDNIPSRFILADAAKHANIPMVSAAIAGLFGHVTTIFPDGEGLESIFGPKGHGKRTKGIETSLGCLAPGVNLIASLECTEVLKVLLSKPNTLKNKLLIVDLNDYIFETMLLS